MSSGQAVHIVIVNWNTGKLLAKCVKSLMTVSDRARIRSITIVDNHSTDGSVRLAATAADSIAIPFSVIELSENAGFARANNKGITQAQRKFGADAHSLLLNPDTAVSSGALTALLSEIETNAKAGIVGPRLEYPNGSLQSSVRAFPTLPVLVFFFLRLHRIFPHSRIWRTYMRSDFNYSRRQSVDQLMGAALLIRNELIWRVGLLDEQFWIWFEEVDYCRRAKSAGWEVVYTPAGKVTHVGAASFDQLVGLRKTLPFLRSALVYARKHLGTLAWIILILLAPIAILLALPSSLVHIVQRKENKKQL